MTPIQKESLPSILAGKDVIAQAKTGSGKTAAFGLGLLQSLNVKRFCVQSIILCPTRELADQVAKALRKMARAIHNIKILTLCGGMPLGPQIGSLEHGAHIVVGTPGRIEEHLRKRTLSLDSVTTLVLDEADRMLDMGFEESLNNILPHIPVDRQTLLFSATYPERIEAIAQKVMAHPVHIKLEEQHDQRTIKHEFYRLPDDIERISALHLLLIKFRPESCVVFCHTKRDTDEVAEALYQLGFSALALHGDLDQKQRDQVLVRFSNRSVSILVATDVAARGLDIEAVDTVFNYQLSRDPAVHTHRIGRTGRAGNQGIACSLFSENERYKLEAIEQFQKKTGVMKELPPLSMTSRTPYKPKMATIQINGGKKQKVRPGDILGALTGQDSEITGKQVGKIDIFDQCAYVAVNQECAKQALHIFNQGKLKGRSFQARRIRGR